MTDRKLGKIEISHDDFRRKVLGLGDEFRVVSVVDNFAGLSVIVESDELTAIPPGRAIPAIDLLYTDNGSVSWRLSNQDDAEIHSEALLSAYLKALEETNQ